MIQAGKNSSLIIKLEDNIIISISTREDLAVVLHDNIMQYCFFLSNNTP